MNATQSPSDRFSLFAFFAGCAMAGLLASLNPEKEGFTSAEEVADFAFSYAEALLKKVGERHGHGAG
ncbi:MAG: hypothetical protein EOM10_10680 [Opitutae bacterium]|nr:hypothetical protein [Opitutae bacterium]